MRSSVLGRLARAGAVLSTALALAVTAAPFTGAAQAHEAVSGTLSFSGEQGEYVSGGQSHAYAAGAVEMFDVSGPTSESAVGVTVVTPEGKRWSLHMEAPYGQKLIAGTTYTGASRWPDAQPDDPKLEFGETDRWCSTSTGSFTITHIAYGPQGYVREVDATFEQYCNGSTLPVRGEVHARMPEPPAELVVGLDLDEAGTIDTRTGQITVGGKVTCNKPASITLNGRVVQTQKQGTPVGYYENKTVTCTPGAPVPWSVSFTGAEPDSTFRPGTATLSGIGRANDRDYPASVDTGYQSTEVTLSKA
ncbi:hypothetical protein RCO28_38960 [Streptomyces sp. LHD-70]|uniref:hypothetical protein n=1 Tax=Streptomyces sp. LHD-70 TaxID=3072140 RepID=UPI00280CB02D|nr:hypothetical protein [Streptomyces sp. LHD-70]MDQ8708395.1 hypothetical protein [Streptomyces sp. LHD-70]